jgi:hypothetical protein
MTFYMNTGAVPENPVYEDKLPEGTTWEDLKAEHGVVIWCKYLACVNNKQFEDTQRTTGTLVKNSSYKPISERENVWRGVCTRQRLIRQDIWISANYYKAMVALTGETLTLNHQSMGLKRLGYTNA